MNSYYLAIDLGASSGRVIAGSLQDGKLVLDEVLRFDNQPVWINEQLCWDFPMLFDHIKQGIALAAGKGYRIKGIGVDTWGVDFGLVDDDGQLVAPPVSYRDQRTKGLIPIVHKRVDPTLLYSITANQPSEINTLYQLFSMVRTGDPVLAQARKLLFIPDLVNFGLTGRAVTELTIASTSQLFRQRKKIWSPVLFHHVDIPIHLMQDIIMPGEIVAPLLSDIAEATGAHGATVYAVGSHDTASAIAAIPDLDDTTAFLSSGTWSIMGSLISRIRTTRRAIDFGFTNEAGVTDKSLFMHNITGLWLLQRYMEELIQEDGSKPSYETLIREAQQAKPFLSIVEPDYPTFVNPERMSEAIAEFCQQTHQAVPETRGEYVRCIIESLAMKYAHVMRKMEITLSRPFKRIHVVGGGSRNDFLNQSIANALGLEVTTGLAEATAIGNIMQQTIASGEIAGWDEAHAIIGRSFTFKHFFPEDAFIWKEAISKKDYIFKPYSKNNPLFYYGQ